MKSILAAKMSAMRKRSALTSSAASSHDGTRDGGGVVKEPTSHHGKMRVMIDDSDPTAPHGDNEELVDIIFCVALDAVHAVTDVDNTILFETTLAAIKEIAWDHTECSLRFVLTDGTTSPPFIFATTLVEVEAQLTAAIRDSDVLRPPDQVYVGVLVGRNMPSSPIQQRRASMGHNSQSIGSIPAVKRRELLAHERPPRQITSREALALQFFKSGSVVFPCSINGDTRGLKLDGSYLCVFPSPDCYDRTACLFSYLYDQVDSCDVRGGTRLELRFHRSATKQPTFIALHALSAQYIRDAIWFFRHGMPMEVYYRRMTLGGAAKAARGAPSGLPTVPASVTPSLPTPQLTVPGRRSSLTTFPDEGALHDRKHSRCVVIGCQRRYTDIGSIPTATEMTTDVDANGGVKSRMIWYCDEHALASSSPGAGSPPRSPSKRSGLLSRGKSSASLAILIHSKHYSQSVRCHGMLHKSGGKYLLTKSWNPKIVALIETPVGGLLVYYDKLAHCPGLSDSLPKERRVIDLSSVMCIRRESSVAKVSGTAMFAFDIVTVYRTWSFATSDKQEYEVWLHALSDAIEKYSSMAPDKALRFPVKCLRDPFQNLPSRSDGTTALEITSNGVTVCSGSDGESEVYNWYFTDIQKWSVAKQNDNTCCFLSCVSTSVEGGSQGVSSSASVITTYHDFLFQTADAEAICSAIEFFVGKCMAKLEVLVAVYSDLQSRQASRRPSLESTNAKTLARGGSSVKGAVGSSAGKQLPLEHVQLLPVGLAVPSTDVEADSQQTTTITPLADETRESDTRLAAEVAHDSLAAEAPAEVQAPVSAPKCDNSPTEAEEVPFSRPRLQLRIDCSSVAVNAPDIGAIESCDSKECSISVASPVLVADESPEHTASESPRSTASEFSTESSILLLQTTKSVSSEQMAEAGPCELAATSASSVDPSIVSLSGGWSDELAVVGLATPIETDQVEVDADRFESFEYCECTIRVADAAATPVVENDDDEAFEDARCGGFDASELSAVVLDGLTGNDEDSLVLLGDDATSTLDVYDVYGPGDPVEALDAVDELVASPSEGEDVRQLEDEEESSQCGMMQQEIPIPEFTDHHWCEEHEDVASGEFDDSTLRASDEDVGSGSE